MLFCDTWISAPIAQLVEQIPLKDKVPGSIPGGRTGFERLNLFRLSKSVRGGGILRTVVRNTEPGSRKFSSDDEKIICDHKCEAKVIEDSSPKYRAGVAKQ